jgi:hypothetical protein
MDAPLISPGSPLLNDGTVIAIEEAVTAICTLSGRISGSFVADAWERRAAWRGFTRAMQLQGAEIDEIDVFSWGCGLPLPGRPRRITVIDEFEPFGAWWSLLHVGDQAGWRDRLPFTPDIQSGLPRLLQALDLMRQYARRDQRIDAWLALPIFLHRLGLTLSPLPCLVAGSKSFRLAASVPGETIRATCKALAIAAQRGLEMLDELERGHRAALRAVQAEYRAGKLVDLLALGLAMGMLSPAGVAKALDISIAGAGKLLDRAAGLGLIVEVSGRRSWKAYVTPDLAVAFGFRRPATGRPRKEIGPSIADASLSGTLAEFDRAMAEIDARLSALGS